jgi:hypothetical protein
MPGRCGHPRAWREGKQVGRTVRVAVDGEIEVVRVPAGTIAEPFGLELAEAQPVGSLDLVVGPARLQPRARPGIPNSSTQNSSGDSTENPPTAGTARPRLASTRAGATAPVQW